MLTNHFPAEVKEPSDCGLMLGTAGPTPDVSAHDRNTLRHAEPGLRAYCSSLLKSSYSKAHRYLKDVPFYCPERCVCGERVRRSQNNKVRFNEQSLVLLPTRSPTEGTQASYLQ